ncbi:putative nitrite reductase [Pseudoclavibacter endophyticus]|nr:nitrite reductase large subunit NirB [Pseudoclavibacter endophyticus]GGA59662.1 putative nitrite reductase [Pseudoclavibacter endophyticus]
MNITTNPRSIAVVGGGPAAHRLVEALADRGALGTSVNVTVLAEEPHAPYDRVQLSKRFEGPTELALADDGFWSQPGVSLRTGTRVAAIYPDTRELRFETGDVLAYDELVMATGSSATRPTIDHADVAHVMRTLDDVDALVSTVAVLRSRLRRAPIITVVGGGLLGLEAAGGVAELGAKPTLVHSRAWLMSSQVDEGAGRTLARLIADRGIDLELGVRPTGIVRAPSGATIGLELTDGRSIPADLVVFAIGITPRDELARDADIALAPRGGIAIDETCASSAPGVWAIGEVAALDGKTVGLVAPANAMAEVVADRLLGGQATFTPFDEATSLKLAGVDVANFGAVTSVPEGAIEVVFADPIAGVYQKLVVGDDARTLLGGVFVGNAEPYVRLRPMLGRQLPDSPGVYLDAGSGADGVELEVVDGTIVCSCKGVTAGVLRDHIRGGRTDLGELKACSGAGTQCGSCVSLVKNMLDRELTAAGVAVSAALCEHTELSRTELFEAVRVLGLQTVGEVQGRFIDGGVGCDICKPVVASIIATQTGGYILDDGAAALQDTNDRALANMQKDGTYSVVPRIPGGEITPDKLAVIAEVAQEYGLYAKITGGQRIDLFGARLEQLPHIWKRLVDAGMESGQAYGKSLRTVKSCVGSTWCRYGVQDSVGMAVFLEERYRGLRSPHKIKFGVSGCARECAEAQGKDIGVIATAEGWNLYVGGNGGMTPKHAELLAKDLDDATLVRYIDRYLMYYIRTADRLQRTARWQEALEGGLDHVRDVVCDDSLGIADELEAAMAKHVDAYEDEWAATLRSPERLRRFQSFVNAPDAPDPSVMHVPDGRGQRRPATGGEREGVLLSGPRIPVGRP